MAGLWAAYNRALTSNPLLVKAATSFTGFTVGDILAQKFINKGEDYDYMRTLRLGSFGALIHGPTGHWFYGMLDKKMPGTAARTVATKVAIDQTIWNPIFGLMFFSYLGITEGKSPSQIVEKIQNDLKTAVMGSWAVWIPAHTINFRFVPTSQRLLYINSIQIGYNVFLSVLGNKGSEPIKEEAHQLEDTMRADLRESKSAIKDQSHEAKDAIRGTAKDAQHKVENFANDAPDKAANAIERTKAEARDAEARLKAQGSSNRAGNKQEDVKGGIQDFSNEALGQAKETARVIKDSAKDAANRR